MPRRPGPEGGGETKTERIAEYLQNLQLFRGIAAEAMLSKNKKRIKEAKSKLEDLQDNIENEIGELNNPETSRLKAALEEAKGILSGKVPAEKEQKTIQEKEKQFLDFCEWLKDNYSREIQDLLSQEFSDNKLRTKFFEITANDEEQVKKNLRYFFGPDETQYMEQLKRLLNEVAGSREVSLPLQLARQIELESREKRLPEKKAIMESPVVEVPRAASVSPESKQLQRLEELIATSLGENLGKVLKVIRTYRNGGNTPKYPDKFRREFIAALPSELKNDPLYKVLKKGINELQLWEIAQNIIARFEGKNRVIEESRELAQEVKSAGENYASPLEPGPIPQSRTLENSLQRNEPLQEIPKDDFMKMVSEKNQAARELEKLEPRDSKHQHSHIKENPPILSNKVENFGEEELNRLTAVYQKQLKEIVERVMLAQAQGSKGPVMARLEKEIERWRKTVEAGGRFGSNLEVPENEQAQELLHSLYDAIVIWRGKDELMWDEYEKLDDKIGDELQAYLQEIENLLKESNSQEDFYDKLTAFAKSHNEKQFVYELRKLEPSLVYRFAKEITGLQVNLKPKLILEPDNLPQGLDPNSKKIKKADSKLYVAANTLIDYPSEGDAVDVEEATVPPPVVDAPLDLPVAPYYRNDRDRERGLESKELTETVNEIFSDVEPKSVKTPHGEIGFFTNKGIGYEDHNEDRIYIDSQREVFLVADGVGGYKGGDRAAQILAEEVKKALEGLEISNATENARRRIEEEGLSQNAGACFALGVIDHEKKLLWTTTAGDTQIFVIDQFGNKIHETPDEGEYNGTGVYNYISANSAKTRLLSFKLKPGYRIIAASDSLTDNFSIETMAQNLMGTNTLDAVKSAKKNIERKMSEADKQLTELYDRYTRGEITKDAYRNNQAYIIKNVGKPDNVSVIIYDYKGEGTVEPVRQPNIETQESEPEFEQVVESQEFKDILLEVKEQAWENYIQSREKAGRVMTDKQREKYRQAFEIEWEMEEEDEKKELFEDLKNQGLI